MKDNKIAGEEPSNIASREALSPDFTLLTVTAQRYEYCGYDTEGYNAQGYDSSGYNSNGYNFEGFNAQGYNVLGYDTRGYNRDGLNAQGHYIADRHSYDAAENPIYFISEVGEVFYKTDQS